MTSTVHPVCSRGGADGRDESRRRRRGDDRRWARRARVAWSSDAPTICGAARADEVARRVARQQALQIVVAERRKLEAPHLGERRHERDRERALA